MKSEYDETMPMNDVVRSYMFWRTRDSGGSPIQLITHDYDYLNGINQFSRSLKRFAEEGQYIRTRFVAGSKRIKSKIEVPPLLRDIIGNQASSLNYWREQLGGCAYSPMIEEYIRVSEEWGVKIDWSRLQYLNAGGDESYAIGINGFLDDLYKRLNDPKITKCMRNHVRTAKKNYQAVCDYVVNMFRQHARVLVIRIDLGYRKYDPNQGLNTQGLLMTGRLTHERVKLDRERFIKALKHRYGKGWVGYTWKLEYTLEKGFHYHMFIFLSGNAHRQDVSLAEEMGEIWRQTITKYMGIYYNCNAKKELYRSKNALGMVHHGMVEKRKNLLMAIGYLIKIDELVRAQTKYSHRTFGKSEMPEVPVLRKGRHRSLEEVYMETAYKNGVNIKNLKRGLTPTGLKRV